ncbi:Syntaxin-5 [Pseudolycoriella hygida]|uniref:Syntaxin-5 n=1 Tax=Pseudolycoriella hygida TaxID=35572 RepID=A0A9Q0S5G6_9DIPT|nr:Syntaxin-5 [Pseudolycoriella hygida]
MPARRRFPDTESDDSFPLIVTEDNEDKKKYSQSRWNIGGFLQQQLAYVQLQPSPNKPQHTALVDNNNSRKESPYLDESEDEVEIVVMTARDRTNEFSTAIRSLQSRNITRAVNIKDPKKATQLQSYGEFMMIAKHVGKNIASTYTKLEKLTLLAKRKSLFDDRPAEIQELTYIIKGDLNSLNQQIAKLQEVSKSQRKTTNGKHLLSHSSNMVLALQAKLANMSTNFKQILEVRTENLKQQKSRRDQFSQGPIASNPPPSTMRGNAQGSLLLIEQDQVAIDLNASSPLLPNQQQNQTQQMMLYDESDNYVQQRAETMQNIESTIVELGGIFQQLAHMVKEQEEMVERIDSNVQDAELNIEAAHGQILKYFQTVSKNRWLMIKIFGVLIMFFIFFVIFLA